MLVNKKTGSHFRIQSASGAEAAKHSFCLYSELSKARVEHEKRNKKKKICIDFQSI